MASPILFATEKKLTADQQECVEKLTQLLEQAKLGNIFTMGVVCCMIDGYAVTIAGKHAAELNLGIDSLKRTVLDRVEKSRG